MTGFFSVMERKIALYCKKQLGFITILKYLRDENQGFNSLGSIVYQTVGRQL